MKGLRYINSHAHIASNINDILTVLNISTESNYQFEKNNTFVYSSGIHPWYIDELKLPEQLLVLEQQLQENKLVAIGECGLDKLKGPTIPIQSRVFIRHVELALKYKKPLIIHCVKAYNELINLLDMFTEKPICIFHGFNKDVKLGLQLIHKGYYLSLGEQLFNSIALSYKDFPVDRILLETDNKDICIKDVYSKASDVFKQPLEQLITQVHTNFKTVFYKSSI